MAHYWRCQDLPKTLFNAIVIEPERPSAMREIQVFKNKRLRQVIGVDRRSRVVGRSMAADIVIPDQRISRKHCVIHYDPNAEEYFVGDLNSKLGTYLNGQRVEGNLALSEGDVISFGDRSAFSLAFVRSSVETAADSGADSSTPGQFEERVTSSINPRELLRLSDDKLRQRPATPEKIGPARNFLEIEQIASSFYDLSCKLALAAHHQQIFEILADHLFNATPAERMVVARSVEKPGVPRADNEATGAIPVAGRHDDAAEFAMLFCEFAAEAPAAARRAGAAFSRSMIARSIREQKALLFATEDKNVDLSASQISIAASSSICAPILGQSGALGCVYLDCFDPRPDAGFNDSHLELAGMCAYIFGLYLERQKAMEEKRESEKLASAGLAVFGAAHYLKNVLTGLQGSRQVIDMLLNNGDIERMKPTWGVLTRSLDAVSGTIKKMLQYARAGRLEFSDVNPIQMMREASEPYLHLMREKGIQFEMEQGGEPFPMRCDATAIDDTLQNLLSNAIDAFKYDRRPQKPQPRIVMRVLFRDSGPRQGVAFEVEDSGPGIPEDARAKVFDLFFSTKGAGGSGLGLALCRKYAVEHGGRLDFQTSDAGTVFRLWLPIRDGYDLESGSGSMDIG
jgi:signal transduction histidine kinase/pSer/pThr/pTyr-binding forkhead associated (FHA) protein